MPPARTRDRLPSQPQDAQIALRPGLDRRAIERHAPLPLCCNKDTPERPTVSNLSERTRALLSRAEAARTYAKLVVEEAAELALEATVLRLRAMFTTRRLCEPPNAVIARTRRIPQRLRRQQKRQR